MLFPAPLRCPSDFSLRVSSPRKLSLILPLPGFFFSWDGIWLHLANVCVWENVPGFNSEAGAGDPSVDETHPGHASGHSFIFPPVLGGSVAPSSQLRHTHPGQSLFAGGIEFGEGGEAVGDAWRSWGWQWGAESCSEPLCPPCRGRPLRRISPRS